MLYACDHTWWTAHYTEVSQSFPGELWTVSESAREYYDLRWIYGTDAAGLSPSLDYIHTGKNSGYQAIGLAYVFGAATITLLGFDFQHGPQGEKHWHGDHPKGLGNVNASRFPSWRRAMDDLARDLKGKRVKVFNASPMTALKCFQRVTLETALNDIRSTERIGNPGGVAELQRLEVR